MDYLIKVNGMFFPDAIGLLLECIEGTPTGVVSQARHGTRLTPYTLVSPGHRDGLTPAFHSQPAKERERLLVLPEAQVEYPARVVRYLVGQGIARSVIDYCIEHRLL